MESAKKNSEKTKILDVQDHFPKKQKYWMSSFLIWVGS